MTLVAANQFIFVDSDLHPSERENTLEQLINVCAILGMQTPLGVAMECIALF